MILRVYSEELQTIELSTTEKKMTENPSFPTAEKMKDLQVLELDLTEDDLCNLVEEHRDNPIMLKAIRDYALKNDMRKVLSMDYKLPEDKLKAI